LTIQLHLLKVSPKLDLRIDGDKENINLVALGAFLIFMTEGGKAGAVRV